MADQQECKYTYQLIDPDEIQVVPATEYLIEGLLVLGEITFFWGAPKFFKTFFVLAMLLCVAMGVPFFGHLSAASRRRTGMGPLWQGSVQGPCRD